MAWGWDSTRGGRASWRTRCWWAARCGPLSGGRRPHGGGALTGCVGSARPPRLFLRDRPSSHCAWLQTRLPFGSCPPAEVQPPKEISQVAKRTSVVRALSGAGRGNYKDNQVQGFLMINDSWGRSQRYKKLKKVMRASGQTGS